MNLPVARAARPDWAGWPGHCEVPYGEREGVVTLKEEIRINNAWSAVMGNVCHFDN